MTVRPPPGQSVSFSVVGKGTHGNAGWRGTHAEPPSAASRPRGRLRRSLGYPRPFRGSVAGILALVLIAGALNALGAGQAWRSVVLGVVLLVGAGLLREGVNAVSNWLTEPGMRKVSGAA